MQNFVLYNLVLIEPKLMLHLDPLPSESLGLIRSLLSLHILYRLCLLLS